MAVTVECDFITMNEFADTLADARPGEGFIYFIGDMAQARHMADKHKDHPKNAELKGVCNLAWSRFISGHVCLTQRRIHSGKYEYIATKRKEIKPVVWRIGTEAAYA